MEELNEWKEQISHDEYNSMIEFINMTKNKQKINNKFLFLHGNIHKTIKLAIDIENAIDVDDCQYIQFDELVVPPGGSMEYLENFIMNKIEKCLIIEDNLFYDGKLHPAYGIIKSLICGDKFDFYDRINDKLHQYVPNFNIIFMSPILPKDSSLLMRSIIINLK